MTRGNHDCKKRFCENRDQNRDVDQLFYMKPLKDALPPTRDRVLYVISDFETTQNTGYTDKATLNVPNLVCLQQFCSRSEDVKKLDGHCV